jgi:hypothetical protein
MIQDITNKTLCPYCEQLIQDFSRDHIFPDFLGGSSKIPACKRCNEVFGGTFEGRAATMLYGVQVSMSTWGLVFNQTVPPWRRAYEHKGVEFDISVEDTEPKLRLSRPIKEIKGDGKPISISFGSEKEAVRAASRAKKKGNDKVVLRTIEVELPPLQVPF